MAINGNTKGINGAAIPYVIVVDESGNPVDPGGAALLASIGSPDDPVATDSTGSWSMISLLKRIAQLSEPAAP